MNKIQKQCEVCGQSFVPKTVDSVYCSKKCGAAAYRKKKALKKKEEEEQQAVIDKISADRLYISVPEAIALFGVAKSTLYRLVRQKRIPAINLGTRLVRIDRAAIEEMFPIRQTPLKKEKPTAKLYSLEPQDCYTIGEIAQKFGISDSTVYKHIRKFSIPTRQIAQLSPSKLFLIKNEPVFMLL